MRALGITARLLAATAIYMTSTQAFAADNGLESADSTLITNPAGTTILGARKGVFSSGPELNLNNAGTIRGNGLQGGFYNPDAGVVIIGGPAHITNSGNISGARFGITTTYVFYPNNTSAGLAIGSTVNNSGSIIGDTDKGIRLVGGGTVTNSGYIAGRVGAGADGIAMFTFDDQPTSGFTSIGTVNNLLGGTIEGFRFGIIQSSGGTINNAGTISGGAGGIVIQALDAGKIGTVTNSGTVNGTVQFNQLDTANVDNSGVISSTTSKGITTSSPSGALVILNRASGSITGATQGIYSEGTSLSVDNAGTIRGNGTSTSFRTPGGGVVITGGPGTITNNGTISGARFGITTAFFSDPVTNAASGRAIGTTVNNSGSIIGDTDDGIRLLGGGTVTNSGYIAGRVGAGADGISMFAFDDQNTSGSTSIGTVTNLAGGVIEGNRLGVILSDGGTVNNAGTINGGSNGAIYIQTGNPGKIGSVVNSGTINGQVGFNDLLASATVRNSGSIAATNAPAVQSDSALTLTNSGAISTSNTVDAAIKSTSQLNITNTASGSIIGLAQGIHVSGPGLTLTNAGTIRGTYTWGILADSGTLNINNSGTIYGRYGGILANKFGIAGSNVYNSGSIISDGSGFIALVLHSGGMVTNSGLIVGDYGVNLAAPGTVINLAGGVIQATSFASTAVSLSDGGTFDNAGTIEGNLFLGASFGTSNVVNNSGTINGNVTLVSTTVTVTNSGTINGIGGLAVTITHPGESIIPLGPTTFVNSGAVNCTNYCTGTTVVLSDFADTVRLLTGSSISGAVDGGLGADNLLLSGTINSATPLQTVGRFVNFETLDVLGGYWTAPTTTGIFTSTTVNGGALAVNGTLSSPVVVNAGAMLAGFGTITGNMTLNSGAILGPGYNGIGTLGVTGNVLFNAGSTFSVETNPNGTSDRLAVNGAVTINNGATIQILAGIAIYPAAGTSYTVLTASGGITGKFDKAVTDYNYFNVSVNTQKKGTITVNLTPNGKPLPSAATASTFSAASAVDSLGATNPLYIAVFNQSLTGARQAFGAFSGSAYARLDELVSDNVGNVRLGLDGPGSDAPAIEWAGISSLAARGVSTGFLTRRGPLSLVMVGGRSTTRLSSDGISGDIDTRFLASAAAYRAGRVQAMASVTSAWHDVAVARTIAFPGFADWTQSRYRATTHRLALDASYGLMRGSVRIAPYAGYAHLMVASPAFSEIGGLSALVIGRESRAMDQVKLGVRAAGNLTLGGLKLAPHLDAAIERLWGAGGVARTARFSSGNSFDSGAYGFNSHAASVDAGLDIAAGPVAITAGYRVRLGDQWNDRSARLSASLRF